jgi:hypothetical protein
VKKGNFNFSFGGKKMKQKDNMWFIVWESTSELPGYGAAYRIRSISGLREMKLLPACSL